MIRVAARVAVCANPNPSRTATLTAPVTVSAPEGEAYRGQVRVRNAAARPLLVVRRRTPGPQAAPPASAHRSWPSHSPAAPSLPARTRRTVGFPGLARILGQRPVRPGAGGRPGPAPLMALDRAAPTVRPSRV